MSEVVLRVEAARDGREVVESVRGHHPGVLDADPAEAKLVEPGLHGDDIAFSQRLVAGLAKRRLLVHIETNAVAGAVVHLGHAIRTLVANRRSPIAAVDQDLAYGEVNVFARHTRPDRLHPRVERLQRGGMHALKFIGYLADDHRAREVPVVVAAAPHWKDVDDHRRTCPICAVARRETTHDRHRSPYPRRAGPPGARQGAGETPGPRARLSRAASWRPDAPTICGHTLRGPRPRWPPCSGRGRDRFREG